MLINWSFIAQLQGGRRLVGYVPAANGSAKGVMVATGVDLGQWSVAQIGTLPVAETLKAKLRTYAGVTGQDAEDLLAVQPLQLTSAEAEALDKAVRDPIAQRLIRDYDAALIEGRGLRRFNELPEAAQTVIASVAFQYGSDLKDKTPQFWGMVTSQDWPAAVRELENFGDGQQARRRREAQLLKSVFA